MEMLEVISPTINLELNWIFSEARQLNIDDTVEC